MTYDGAPRNLGASDPIDRVLDALRYEGPRPLNQYKCICPAHDDRNPSLSVTEKDGKVLLKCFAECSTDAVLRAMGLTFADLDPQSKSSRAKSKSKGRIVAIYDYHDEAGNVLHQTVRFDPKDFLQRRPNGKGGYVWKLGTTRRVLYKLPDLLAADPDQWVFVVEGEKDANNLIGRGLVATTNAMGAGSWIPDYNQSLVGRRVCVLPDNDEKGQEHAQDVATQLLPHAKQIRIVKLPNLPYKGDVSDWLANGGNVPELLKLVEETPDGYSGKQRREPPQFVVAPPATATNQNEVPPPEAEKAPRFERLNLSELISRPPKSWIIDQIAGLGDLVMIYGAPGTGKSFVAIDLALSAALGRSFAGRFAIARPLTVAYAASEGASGLAQRFQAASAYYGVEDGNLPNLYFFPTPPQLYQRADFHHAMYFIEEWQAAQDSGQVGKLDLLILDTFHGVTADGDENSTKDMGIVLDAAKQIADRLGCIVLLVHHTNKAGTAERGNSSLRGAMDCMMEVKANGSRTLICDKVKDGAPWKPQTFDLIAKGEYSVRVDWGSVTDFGQGDTVSAKLLTILSATPGEKYTANFLAETIGAEKSSTVPTVLNRLVDRGELKRQLEKPDKAASNRNPWVYWWMDQP